jgi:uncharacterized protein
MLFLLAIILVSVLAGGVASVSGFGIGSLLTPLVGVRYGIKAAVVMVAVPHAIATALRFWSLRKDVDWGVFLRFGLINAAGALVGALIHTKIESPVLGIVLGILLVFAGLLGLTGFADKLRFRPNLALLAGAASGAFGGLVGNQGGIRSAAMLGLGLQGPRFVATATAIALAVDGARLPFYIAFEGRQILNAWPDIAAAIVGVVIGTIAGADLLRRIPEPLFKRVVSAILLGVGAFLLLVMQK